MENVLYGLLIIYLSFMYYINQKIIIGIVQKDHKKKQFIYINYFILWFVLVIVIMILLYNLVPTSLKLPNKYLSIPDTFIIILSMIPFMVYSNYKPHKSKKGIIAFCLLFPIGEEIIFRSLIPSILNKMLLNPSSIIIVPLLNEVSLSIIISSLLFGIMHLQYYGFKLNKNNLIKVMFAFIYGIFIGKLVEVTGSLFYAMLFHIIANSGATYVYYKKTKY